MATDIRFLHLDNNLIAYLSQPSWKRTLANIARTLRYVPQIDDDSIHVSDNGAVTVHFTASTETRDFTVEQVEAQLQAMQARDDPILHTMWLYWEAFTKYYYEITNGMQPEMVVHPNTEGMPSAPYMEALEEATRWWSIPPAQGQTKPKEYTSNPIKQVETINRMYNLWIAEADPDVQMKGWLED
ncbi:MAG: hypothetical protein Q9170_002034 [Blastenia crenularia]